MYEYCVLSTCSPRCVARARRCDAIEKAHLNCTKCGSGMLQMRTNGHTGEPFWGCNQHNRLGCRGSASWNPNWKPPAAERERVLQAMLIANGVSPSTGAPTTMQVVDKFHQRWQEKCDPLTCGGAHVPEPELDSYKCHSNPRCGALPECDRCGGTLSLRSNRNSGNKFWGCLNYRHTGCRFTANYKKQVKAKANKPAPAPVRNPPSRAAAAAAAATKRPLGTACPAAPHHLQHAAKKVKTEHRNTPAPTPAAPAQKEAEAPNAQIIRALKKIGDFVKSNGEGFRFKAYAGAVAAISALPHDLASGKSMAAKIDEIIQTGTVAQYRHVVGAGSAKPPKEAPAPPRPDPGVHAAAPLPPPRPALSPDAEAALLRQTKPAATAAAAKHQPDRGPAPAIKPEKASLADAAAPAAPAVTTFAEADYGPARSGYEAQDEDDPTKWWPVSLYGKPARPPAFIRHGTNGGCTHRCAVCAWPPRRPASHPCEAVGGRGTFFFENHTRVRARRRCWRPRRDWFRVGVVWPGQVRTRQGRQRGAVVRRGGRLVRRPRRELHVAGGPEVVPEGRQRPGGPPAPAPALGRRTRRQGAQGTPGAARRRRG